MDTTQEILDYAGFIPGLGTIPDVLNTTIHLARGNYEEALWSGIGAVPIVGDSVSGIRKVSKVSSAVNNPDLYYKGVGKVDKISKSGKGYIKYGELDSLGRATKAEAYITKDMLRTGSGAAQNRIPKGFDNSEIKNQHHRGHLIANVLGGSGKDIRNITTLHAKANTPYMRNYEMKIRDAVQRGENVKYKVTPEYIGEGYLSRGVTLDAKGDKGYSLYVTILNKR